jgi:hypothetical protein
MRKHILLMSLSADKTFPCEQLYSLMKNAKSRTITLHTDEHVEGRTPIAAR